MELAGLALIDMSAAFDCVDTDLLLAKLDVMGSLDMLDSGFGPT